METLKDLHKRYEKICAQNLAIHMERGWPCKEQLDLSLPMLDTVTSKTVLEKETDYRSYDGTGGILPLKRLFVDLLEVAEEEIYIGGTMSTTIMYDIVAKAMLFGLSGNTPWGQLDKVKFICPSPGYEKHFKICETFDIEMIPVSIDEQKLDISHIEALVAKDEAIKGIWCVPIYSNPTGTIYDDDTIRRLAFMPTKAADFRIFWDNAYFAHRIDGEIPVIPNIIRLCEEAGNPNRVFEFASTSKITFPGGGVGVCASSKENIHWLTKNSLLQLKTGDKINQLRHYLFLKNRAGLQAHMDKHRAILKPKFDAVDNLLHTELDGLNIASWQKPCGGYFFNLKLLPNMAVRTWELCKNAGVYITPAGSTFPYGNDPEDAHLRLAPTYLPIDQLEKAIRVLCLSIKIAYEERREIPRE